MVWQPMGPQRGSTVMSSLSVASEWIALRGRPTKFGSFGDSGCSGISIMVEVIQEAIEFVEAMDGSPGIRCGRQCGFLPNWAVA
jgi:hypothetical protein